MRTRRWSGRRGVARQRHWSRLTTNNVSQINHGPTVRPFLVKAIFFRFCPRALKPFRTNGLYGWCLCCPVGHPETPGAAERSDDNHWPITQSRLPSFRQLNVVQELSREKQPARGD